MELTIPLHNPSFKRCPDLPSPLSDGARTLIRVISAALMLQTTHHALGQTINSTFMLPEDTVKERAVAFRGKTFSVFVSFG